MKKIALIEDRTKRQELFIEATKIDLDGYLDILDNIIEDSYQEFKDTILKDDCILDKYDIIISHRSAFEDKNSQILSIIEKHCEKFGKPLIYFSGGISVNLYSHDNFDKLILNSKTFYSQNLKIFLDAVKEDKENILMLSYGNNWKLNIVLNNLENVNLFLERYKLGKKDIDEFDNSKIRELEQIDFPFFNVKLETIDAIKKFRDALVEFIEEADYE